jgi:hypothetical protein
MSPFVAQLAVLVTRIADETPKPEDVKAGWGALAVFLLLIGAVVLLGFSLTKQLRKAQAAEEAGVYGADAPRSEDAQDAAEPEKHEAP